MAKKSLVLIVISFYDRRPADNLIRLLDSMKQYEAGADYDLSIVVNQSSDKKIELPTEYKELPILYRNNVGMNIGAWEYGWLKNPNFEYYLFLQDECYITRKDWVSSFLQEAQKPGVGMCGESLNNGWDYPWDQLQKHHQNDDLPEHELNGSSTNRVDFYLHTLKENKIPAGEKGRHLRSLIWFLSRDVLQRIHGFPIGNNYGECIAFEIGVSKKVEKLGLMVSQVNNLPFHYIRHLEWNQDSKGAEFTHNPLHFTKQQLLKRKIRELEKTINSPSWTLILKLIKRRIQLYFLS
jgi:hypothetical protein